MEWEEVIELAEAQHGVVGRHQLRELGLDGGDIRRLAGASGWEAVTPVVLRRRGSPSTRSQRVSAAVLDAGPGAVLSHEPACAWWGHQGSRFFPIQCSTTRSTRRRSRLARVHRVRSLPEQWLRVYDGVPVVAPELVALHLFATTHPDRAARLVDAMWSMGILSGGTVGRLLAEYAKSGRNGIVRLREWWEVRGDDYVPPDSGKESRFQGLMERSGIPMERQVNSGDHRQWLGRVDFRHPWLPLIVEVQSEFRHSSDTERADDRRRIAALREAGYVVAEIHEDLLFRDGAAVIRQVRGGLARASAKTSS